VSVYVGNVSDIGPKQTFSIALHMSTFDPKRTWWRCAHSNAQIIEKAAVHGTAWNGWSRS
jgi:hypothetical protein